MEPPVIVATLIQPRIRDGEVDVAPDISQILLRVEQPALPIDQPPIELDVSRNMGAHSAAPTLAGATTQDIGSYVKLAALLPGEGVTVVLRVEVLESGETGRIEVDASSGSRQVDQAAVAYARTLHWNAGRVDGTPRSMWIRWGVRLQA